MNEKTPVKIVFKNSDEATGVVAGKVYDAVKMTSLPIGRLRDDGTAANWYLVTYEDGNPGMVRESSVEEVN